MCLLDFLRDLDRRKVLRQFVVKRVVAMLDAEQLQILLWVRTIRAVLVDTSHAQKVLQIRLLCVLIEVFKIADDHKVTIRFAF